MQGPSAVSKQMAAPPAVSQNGKPAQKLQQNGRLPAANGHSNGGAVPPMAEQLKQEGNAAFKAGDYSGAVEAYGAAMELDPRNPVLYSNRAMASLKVSSASSSLLVNMLRSDPVSSPHRYVSDHPPASVCGRHVKLG